MKEKSDKENLGGKVRRLREKEGLTVEELAAQVEMKPSKLQGPEQGEYLPNVGEIISISRRLSVEPSSMMAESPAPDSRRKAHSVRTKDYAYETLTEYQQGSHLMAFMVGIGPESTHKKVGYRHEGEEFVYVLSGRLKIKVGDKSTNLSQGQSIRFNSGQKHVLSNPGKEPSKLLVVIYAP